MYKYNFSKTPLLRRQVGFQFSNALGGSSVADRQLRVQRKLTQILQQTFAHVSRSFYRTCGWHYCCGTTALSCRFFVERREVGVFFGRWPSDKPNAPT